MAKGDNLTATSTGTATAQSEVPESGRSAEEIRQDIAARRESITDTVDRLSDRFQQTFDWRTYVSNYPVVALGVAAGLGLLVSRIFKPRPTPTERMKDAVAELFEDVTDRVRSQMEDLAPQRPGASHALKGAVTGMLMKSATDFLRNQISGAGNGRERMRGGRSSYPRTYQRDDSE
jgi:ElaB/YqjD/DUF883 family membrane-anchored ribosome-binding protein